MGGTQLNAVREAVHQTLRVHATHDATVARVEQIQRLQKCMEELPASQKRDLPITHRFAPGQYAREMFAPVDTVIVSKTHRYEHFVFVMRGDILIADETGVRRVTAPATFVSKAGTKRVGYTLADTVWTTVHATSETDLEKLEAELMIPDVPQLKGELQSAG